MPLELAEETPQNIIDFETKWGNYKIGGQEAIFIGGSFIFLFFSLCAILLFLYKKGMLSRNKSHVSRKSGTNSIRSSENNIIVAKINGEQWESFIEMKTLVKTMKDDMKEIKKKVGENYTSLEVLKSNNDKFELSMKNHLETIYEKLESKPNKTASRKKRSLKVNE